MGTRSHLEKVLKSGIFAVTAEIGPPKNADPEVIKKKAQLLKGFVDAVNITDCQTAIVRLSSMASAVLIMSEGLEPVMQMTCRDRNRIGIQSDLLGAYALGIRNLLCLTGDHPKFGNHPQAKPVFDIDSIQLLDLVKGLSEGKFANGEEIKGIRPQFFRGAVENPFADPLYFRPIRLAKKVKAGAEFIQTQIIYNVERFKEFMKMCEDLGILDKVYILAGITPPKSFGMARYMKYNVPGLDVPDEILKRLKSAKDPKEEGINIAVEIIQQVKEIPGVRGVHIMAIEWEEAVPEIVKRAGLLPRPEIEEFKPPFVVEKIIEKPVEVVVEKVVEKPVEVVVEKVVEKPVSVEGKVLSHLFIDILSDLKAGLKSIQTGVRFLEEILHKLEGRIPEKEIVFEKLEKIEEAKPEIKIEEKPVVEVERKVEEKAEVVEEKVEEKEEKIEEIFEKVGNIYRPLSERAKTIKEDLYKEVATGEIKEVIIGKGEKAIKIGGVNALNFHLFEGEMKNDIKIAMEILDIKPEDWPESLAKYFADVYHDPALWAKKCVEEYNAEAICIYLMGTDPNYKDLPVEHAKEVVSKVVSAVDVPIIVWGSGNPEKDVEILKEVADIVKDRGALIGPVVEGNYRTLAAVAMGYDLPVIASTPIDVNLAKQLNILLEGMGIPLEKIVMDPSIGALGYGIEYTYSVMERIRLASLFAQDTKLQVPFICSIGKEVWKTKETQLPTDEIMGEMEGRGILMEALTGVAMALAGGDLLIMRHPKAIELCKSLFKSLTMS